MKTRQSSKLEDCSGLRCRLLYGPRESHRLKSAEEPLCEEEPDTNYNFPDPRQWLLQDLPWLTMISDHDILDHLKNSTALTNWGWWPRRVAWNATIPGCWPYLSCPYDVMRTPPQTLVCSPTLICPYCVVLTTPQFQVCLSTPTCPFYVTCTTQVDPSLFVITDQFLVGSEEVYNSVVAKDEPTEDDSTDGQQLLDRQIGDNLGHFLGEGGWREFSWTIAVKCAAGNTWNSKHNFVNLVS